MFALAVEGLALVNEGEVAEGMRCLDEATPRRWRASTRRSCRRGGRLLLAQCLRAGARLRARGGVVPQGRGVQPQDKDNFVTLACRAHYGAVSPGRGAGPRPSGSSPRRPSTSLAERPSWSGLAIVRLADLRRRQGRFAEAEELLERRQGNPLAPVVMAELALDLGDASAAR